VFAMIAERGRIEPEEMWRVFNMGCGFCCVVPADRADEAVAVLARHHPGTEEIGRVTDSPGRVSLPTVGLQLT
jgi:phosphoribosylformylglycinamidine cyclo-ligase